MATTKYEIKEVPAGLVLYLEALIAMGKNPFHVLGVKFEDSVRPENLPINLN